MRLWIVGPVVLWLGLTGTACTVTPPRTLVLTEDPPRIALVCQTTTPPPTLVGCAIPQTQTLWCLHQHLEACVPALTTSLRDRSPGPRPIVLPSDPLQMSGGPR